MKNLIVLSIFMLLISCGNTGQGEVANPEETSMNLASSSSIPVRQQSAPAMDAVPPQQTDLSQMIEIPAGEFTFGMEEEHLHHWITAGNVYYQGIEERYRKDLVIPERRVYLDTFYIDKFETTNREYKEFLEATGYRPSNPKNYLKEWTSSNSYPEWAADFPVVWVSQKDAEAYCRWRGKRLPTEQEWEKAARGEKGLYYPWGELHPKRETTNISSKKLELVGNRPLDKSPYGVYDMGGNVAELTSSLTPEGRVITKGGSITSLSRNSRTYGRALVSDQDFRSGSLGFRCAADPR